MRTYLLILVLVWPATGLAERVMPSNRVSSGVTIRAEPRASSNQLGLLRVGEVARLLSNVPRWRRIALPDGSEGFVSKSWTTVVPDIPARAQDHLRLHFLNIGGGTCTVVECPGQNARPIIVDCGSLGGSRTESDLTADEARLHVARVLSAHSQSPFVVLSHGDSDHYGWIDDILPGVTVGSVWQGGDPGDYTSSGFPAWLAQQTQAGVPVVNGFAPEWNNDGTEITGNLSCGDASVWVLTVNGGTSKNAKSLVLMLEYGEFTATLTGDAEGSTERDIRENWFGAVKTTVLAGSHHGSRTHQSNSAAWADTTAPNMTVFSAGTKFHHPRCEAVSRYRSHLSATPEHRARCGKSAEYDSYRTTQAEFMTEANGTIVVTTNGNSPMQVHCNTTGCAAIAITH